MHATATALLLACILPACGIPPATVAALALALLQPNMNPRHD